MLKHLKSKAKNKDGQVIINLFSLSENLHMMMNLDLKL